MQRKVRGSEAEKDNLMPKFLAMRIFCGCSSLFFTLTPHDIRSPLVVSMLHGEGALEKIYSLDFNDAQAEQYVAELLGAHPRMLHELVAQHQLFPNHYFQKFFFVLLVIFFEDYLLLVPL